MSAIFFSFSMDYAMEVQHAQRADGQWFKRMQVRNRFGYSWTRWKFSGPRPETSFAKGVNARLPKGNSI